MCLRGQSYEQQQENIFLTVAAGEVFDDVISKTVDNGWWGLENLSAIPGSVGATPVQNVGAYGVEVASLIESVEVLHLDTLTVESFSNEKCEFTYRDSLFKKDKNLVVLSVTFKLSLKPNPQLHYVDLKNAFTNLTPSLEAIRQQTYFIRAAKFPDWHVVGTAGSFFKNPVVPQELAISLVQQYPNLPVYDYSEGYKKVSLGFILDKICNLKGYCENGVCLFFKQALVLTVNNDCSADAVINFANNIKEKVFQKTKIDIEWEVQLIK